MIAVALALIVGIISHFATVSSLKKNAENKIGNAEAKAREIIDDAVKTAETTKKEALLEVKEESIKTKNELEKETKERRAELQRYEKRVLAKEEAVEKRSDSLEHRESKLSAKEEQLRQREARVEELSQKRVQELERISGLTSEQAKEYLLKTVEEDVKQMLSMTPRRWSGNWRLRRRKTLIRRRKNTSLMPSRDVPLTMWLRRRSLSYSFRAMK